MNPVVILGSAEESGAYVLRMVIADTLLVRFGRFQSGRPVEVSAGEALYVGSAMAARGSTTLARRLLRHATRCGRREPQALRAVMLESFRRAGLGPYNLAPPAQKRPLWHIDYLLDEPAVTLSQAFVVRSQWALENLIADMLASDPATQVIAPGLGAQDRRGKSHLLAVQAAEAWWAELPGRLQEVRAAVDTAVDAIPDYR